MRVWMRVIMIVLVNVIVGVTGVVGMLVVMRVGHPARDCHGAWR